ncbi:DUF2786 domain-containing protein [Terrabacter carboxydivorans]|uniref:DUF2786 domain-containing protein n=1 Tax=Terrabacter carboxydivorans TaxID=619730 RepID=A0ABN3KYG1_9MICO
MGKARRRQRQGTERSTCDPRTQAAFEGPASDEETRSALHGLLTEAFDALDHWDEHGLDFVAATMAALCASPSTRRAAVLTLLDSTTTATTHAWQIGWQPADLHRLVGRRLGAPEQGVVVDVMAHELGQYAPATVDARWLAQLREVDDRPPGPRSTTWIEARRAAGTDWFTLVSQVITVLHLLARLPTLEHLTPVPGEALPGPGQPEAAGAAAVDERILSRVRMLLAKAESTTFEAEAATFTAGAQSLMARHSIDAALLTQRADRTDRDGPRGRRIGIDNPYDGPKAVLLQAVVSANRCRMVWSRELGFGTVVGFEADLDAVELLFTSLLVQATRTLAAAGSRSTLHGGSRTRSFRQSFLAAFADRIGERLHEATAREEEAAFAANAGGRELVPLLAARAEQVDEALGTWFPEVRQTRVSAARDAEGWHSGRTAADRAQLGASPRLGA